MRSYGMVRQLFQTNGQRFGFLPATSRIKYPTVDFQFQGLSQCLQSLIRPESRDYGPPRGCVELCEIAVALRLRAASRFICFRHPMDFRANARLRSGEMQYVDVYSLVTRRYVRS